MATVSAITWTVSMVIIALMSRVIPIKIEKGVSIQMVMVIPTLMSFGPDTVVAMSIHRTQHNGQTLMEMVTVIIQER